MPGIVVQKLVKKYDKKYYCLFCEAPYHRLPRHLIAKHSDEDEVKRYKDAKEPERGILLMKMRNLGNHQHNTRVFRDGHGTIEVVYRSSSGKGASADAYVPCQHCFGWFGRDELWKHVGRCPLNVDKKKKSRHITMGELLKPAPQGINQQLQKIFSTLHNDDVSVIIKNDPLICMYGERLALKHGYDTSRFTYVRSRLREIARLLVEMRKLEPSIIRLSDAVKPKHFGTVLQAARIMAEYNVETNLFQKPSLALKVGTTFTATIDILLAKAIEDGNQTNQQECQDLKKLMDLRWSSEFTNNAHRSNVEKKKNVINLVPLTEDLKKLSDYLKDEINQRITELKSSPMNFNYFMQLQKALLALVILFNRRRSGEVSRMRLDDYSKCTTGSQVLSGNDLELSKLESQFVDSFTRVEMTGKKGRTVAVLLTGQMKEALDLLVSSRKVMGIPETNLYVFCIGHGSDNYLRGWDVLRHFSSICGAKRPEAIRSTRLRKHIATMTQIMNLREHELDVLADFMGHNIRVHREVYRMSSDVMQIAKVSKFLLAAEKGELNKYKGKHLDEIPIADDELDGKLLCSIYVHKFMFSNYSTNQRVTG